MKEKAETVEITIPVKIRYSTPKGRERAIEWAHELARIGGWSSECGGISVNRAKGKRTGGGMNWIKFDAEKPGTAKPANRTDCVVLCEDGQVFRAVRAPKWMGGWKEKYRSSCVPNVTHYMEFCEPKE